MFSQEGKNQSNSISAHQARPVSSPFLYLDQDVIHCRNPMQDCKSEITEIQVSYLISAHQTRCHTSVFSQSSSTRFGAMYLSFIFMVENTTQWFYNANGKHYFALSRKITFGGLSKRKPYLY